MSDEPPNEQLQLTRRVFLKDTAAIALAAATKAEARQSGAPTEHVYLEYDQAELDAAYDQRVWAPNMEQVLGRLRSQSERALSRLGRPERIAYGPTESERLDLYRTDRGGAPIHIFIHGGAWRGGGGSGRAAGVAEVFVRSRGALCRAGLRSRAGRGRQPVPVG